MIVAVSNWRARQELPRGDIPRVLPGVTPWSFMIVSQPARLWLGT